MLEVLSPAGSYEGVQAAVQNGADAVYLGLEGFNARRNAKNFTEEGLARAIAYCHIRGVKVYVTMNTLVTDRELVQIERSAKAVSRLGADAIIVQDLGAMGTIRQVLPEMPLHASTQMGVHNLEGVEKAAFFGASRVILARELSLEQMAHIKKNTDMELEVFCHGALCMCYSGQCYMSAVIGGRSGNRGLCAQPCRLPYRLDGDTGHHLSLKDYNLSTHLAKLEEIGITCVKIEGRMKRPEYTAIVTRIYSDLIREKRQPTSDETLQLHMAFSRDGFTDAYIKGEKGKHMLGIRDEENKKEPSLFDEVRRDYLNSERKRVPIRFFAMIQAGKPAKLAVQDDKENLLRLEAAIPEPANTRELTEEGLSIQLDKTGGTPYYCEDIQIVLDRGLNLPVSEINHMRRSLLDELTKVRGEKPSMPPEKLFRPGGVPPERELPPQLNVSLRSITQLTDEFFDLKPSIIYMPVDEMLTHQDKLMPYLADKPSRFVPALPQILTDNERDAYSEKLKQTKALGMTDAMVSHMGHIDLCKDLELNVRGDFGFHVMNGLTLKSLKHLPLSSVTLSFECNMAQIRDMPKHMDTELIAYGRVPVMIMENCVLQNVKNKHICDTPQSLIDKQGLSFPVMKSGSCRSELFNSRKIFLADKAQDYMHIGLWGVRLCFTTENPRECVEVLKRYLGLGTYEPGGFTRGLYYRGVE